MRVFFAIELPEDLQQELATFAGSLEGDLRRVRPEQIHLTLRFVGDVHDEDVPALINVARASLTGPPFTLQVEGGGAFGSRTRPRVLWAGATGEVRRAVGVVRALEHALRRLGYPSSERPFSPHVTLARVLGRVPPTTLERLAETPSVLLPVSQITLFQSELLPGGARHSAVHRFELRRPEEDR